MLNTIFPKYQRIMLVQPAICVSTTVLYLAIGIMRDAIQASVPPFMALWPSFLLCIFISLAGWYATFEFLFVGTFLLLNATGFLIFQEQLVIGLYVIVIFWMIRFWIVPAVFTLVINAIILLSILDVTSLQISAILTTILVAFIGIILQQQNARRIQAENAKQKAQEISINTRKELARSLHDGTAKDLAHILLMLQDLQRSHPELTTELAPLFELASTASKRLRPLVWSITIEAANTLLTQTITDVQTMLTTRKISLQTTVPDKLDEKIDEQQRRLAALAIREGGTNILKYAPANSQADLVIDLKDNQLAISLSNQISPDQTNFTITGGFGLTNLQTQIAENNGQLEYTRLSDRWILYFTIPKLENSKDNSDSEKQHG